MNAWFSQMFSGLHGEQVTEKQLRPDTLPCGLLAVTGPSSGGHVRKGVGALGMRALDRQAMLRPGEFPALAF